MMYYMLFFRQIIYIISAYCIIACILLHTFYPFDHSHRIKPSLCM